ncbi:MAG: hypothetical protein JW739_05725 [Opitutales bacterium]|nr:hypothetical protein [Opitutales bacterium]
MKLIFITILVIGFVMLIMTGCATSGQGTTKTPAQWLNSAITISTPGIELAANLGTKAILTKNPDLVDEFRTINQVATAIFKGSFDDDDIEKIMAAAWPDMDTDVLSQIADILSTAVNTISAFYEDKTGQPFSLEQLTDDNIDSLLNAINSGVSAGIASFKGET